MLVLEPFVFTFLSVEILCVLFAFIATLGAIKISLKYDLKSTTKEQYQLSNYAYLVSAIVKFILCVKIPLFLFFIWTLDETTRLVPGAMCAAGVVSATNFGEAMFMVKILNLFLFSGWLYLNSLDFKTPTCAYAKLKFKIFCAIFIFAVLEVLLEISHFVSVDTDKQVQCCGEIFKESIRSNFAFYHNEIFIFVIFYTIFLANIFFAVLKKPVAFGASGIAFLFVCIYALIRVFSPYIYEMPLHKCPFCMIDAGYYFVGYFIYVLLYLGAIGGVFALISCVVKEKFSPFWYKFSSIMNIANVLLLTTYVIIYILKNGVSL